MTDSRASHLGQTSDLALLHPVRNAEEDRPCPRTPWADSSLSVGLPLRYPVASLEHWLDLNA